MTEALEVNSITTRRRDGESGRRTCRPAERDSGQFPTLLSTPPSAPCWTRLSRPRGARLAAIPDLRVPLQIRERSTRTVSGIRLRSGAARESQMLTHAERSNLGHSRDAIIAPIVLILSVLGRSSVFTASRLTFDMGASLTFRKPLLPGRLLGKGPAQFPGV
jgi:hypothetical protein